MRVLVQYAVENRTQSWSSIYHGGLENFMSMENVALGNTLRRRRSAVWILVGELADAQAYWTRVARVFWPRAVVESTLSALLKFEIRSEFERDHGDMTSDYDTDNLVGVWNVGEQYLWCSKHMRNAGMYAYGFVARLECQDVEKQLNCALAFRMTEWLTKRYAAGHALRETLESLDIAVGHDSYAHSIGYTECTLEHTDLLSSTERESGIQALAQKELRRVLDGVTVDLLGIQRVSGMTAIRDGQSAPMARRMAVRPSSAPARFRASTPRQSFTGGVVETGGFADGVTAAWIATDRGVRCLLVSGASTSCSLCTRFIRLDEEKSDVLMRAFVRNADSKWADIWRAWEQLRWLETFKLNACETGVERVEDSLWNVAVLALFPRIEEMTLTERQGAKIQRTIGYDIARKQKHRRDEGNVYDIEHAELWQLPDTGVLWRARVQGDPATWAFGFASV
jgi:hypothetical protein